MVDFQERDTTRGLGSDDEDDEDDRPPGATIKEEDAESESEETVDEEPAEEADPDESHDHDDHDHHAHDVDIVSAAVVTVSSTRSRDDDPAGDAIVEGFVSAGNEVATRDLVRDDFDNIQAAVDALVGRDDVDVVVTTGGTGVSPDDVTVEAVEPLFEKRLPGFGELFRRRSQEEIGTKVVGSRATAGIADGVPVFCLPGSEHAARLGTEEIIVGVAGHLAGLAGESDE